MRYANQSQKKMREYVKYTVFGNIMNIIIIYCESKSKQHLIFQNLLTSRIGLI